MSGVEDLLNEIEAVGNQQHVTIPYRSKIKEVLGMCVESPEIHELFLQVVDLAVRKGIDLD